MKHSNRGIYGLTLLCTDVVSYHISLFVAFIIRSALGALSPRVEFVDFTYLYFVKMWWMPLVFIFFMFLLGMYHKREPFWLESGSVLKAVIFSAFIILTIITLGRLYLSISRLFIIILFAVLPVVVSIARYFVKLFMFRFDSFLYKTIVVGKAMDVANISKALTDEKILGLKIIATFSYENRACHGELMEYVENNSIDVAVLASADNRQTKLVYGYLHKHIAQLYYIPEAALVTLANATAIQLLKSQFGYLLVTNSIQRPTNRAIKRSFDLVIAILLLPLIIPIIAVLSIVIKSTSKGKTIFSHARVGRDGKMFNVYKLRTMYTDAQERLSNILATDDDKKREWETYYKLKDDPRITKIGHFLRKSSLDELPQIFNIIKGEMSFVGPRPVLQEELDRYYKDDRAYYAMAVPGITGLWQVSGRNDISYAERISMDCWYIFNWSLWLDMVILFSTPLVVILRRGAY